MNLWTEWDWAFVGAGGTVAVTAAKYFTSVAPDQAKTNVSGWIKFIWNLTGQIIGLRKSGSIVTASASFKLTVGRSGECLKSKYTTLYTVKRTLLIKVENTDPLKTRDGCKVQLLRIIPEEYHGPWLVEEGFKLAAGDYRLIPLVSYGEADNRAVTNYADSFMEVLTKGVIQPKPSINARHTLQIRVTAFDVAPTDYACNIWVDDHGQVQIAEECPTP